MRALINLIKAARDLAEEALAAAHAAAASSALVRLVLGNNVEAHGTGTVGTTSQLDAAPITSTPGAPGSFYISAGTTVQPGGGTAVAGDRLVFQLLENGTPLEPVGNATFDAELLEDVSVAWVSNPGPGTYTYSIRVSDQTGGHTMQATAARITVQETF